MKIFHSFYHLKWKSSIFYENAGNIFSQIIAIFPFHGKKSVEKYQ